MWRAGPRRLDRVLRTRDATSIMASWLHTAWQKLPRGLRQRAFVTVTSLGVPAAEPGTRLIEPVVVAGVLRAATGLGQAARLALHALRAAGARHASFDLTTILRQTPSEAFEPGRAIEPGPGTLLLFVTPPNLPLALHAVGRRNLAGKHRIGAWVCETERLPGLWRQQAAFLDRIVAPSRFSQAAIALSTGRAVDLLIHPVEAEPWPVEGQAPRGVPTLGAVLDVGSSAARKNVEGLVEAGLQLVKARRDMRLIWKVRDLRADPNAAARLRQAAAAFPDQIRLLEGDWARADLFGFLDQIDLLASFSRAEGFGLPIAEAMRRGVPVAAPIWGGPVDFLDERTAVALPFTMVPVRDPSDLYAESQGEWADVDLERAVPILARALDDPSKLAALADEARRRSRDLFGVERFMGQLGLARDPGLS